MVISGNVIEKPNKCRFFLRIPYESLSDSIILVDDLNLPKRFHLCATCNKLFDFHKYIIGTPSFLFSMIARIDIFARMQVAGDLLKQYKEKFQGGPLTVTWNYLRESMNAYLSQPNPVTARWEGEEHLRDPKFQLDAFRVSANSFCF